MTTPYPLAANDWKNTADRLNSGRNATNAAQLFRALYNECKAVQANIALYKAGTDVVFNSAYNALLTATERTELEAMAVQINNLVTDWETNHAAAIAAH